MATEPLGKPPARRDKAPKPSMTGLFERVILSAESTAPRRPDGAIRRRIKFLLYVGKLALRVVRQWVADRCPQQASSLAFQSVLSIVPIIAIGLVILRATGAFEAESAMIEQLSKQVLPVSRDEISRYLLEWAGNLSFRTAGVMGIIMTLVLSFVMFNSTERIFNDIWRVERRRRFWQKLVVFYPVATIVPALLGISIYQAARFGLTKGIVGFLGALGSTWLALLFANKLLPARRVEWKAAAIGALVSAVAFEVAKIFFHLYVAEVAFQKYAGVYGPMGLIPILLVWIYYSWLVILLGAEVAHAWQHLPEVTRKDDDELVYARVLAAVAAGAPITTDDLTPRFPRADAILARLEKEGLVKKIDAGWVTLPAVVASASSE